MDKIQIIEKLFSYTLEYSYLLLPVIYFFSKHKKDKVNIVLALYGLVFFCFLHFYYDIPFEYRKAQQAIYTLIEFIFFTYIFWTSIENIKTKKIIFSSSILFVLFHIIYFITSENQRIDSIPIGVETICLLFFTFLYFQQYFKASFSSDIYEYPSFWLVVGIVIYLGFSFFFNILANHVTQKQFFDYWHYTYIPEILKNVIFAAMIIKYFSKRVDKIKKQEVPNLDMI